MHRGDRDEDVERDGTSGEGDVPLDLVFDVLGDERRRRVLYALSGADGPVAVADLAARLAELEGTPTDEHRTRLTVSLTHVHLPKLAAAGVVDVDTDRDVVEPTDWPAIMTAFLALAERYECDPPPTGAQS